MKDFHLVLTISLLLICDSLSAQQVNSDNSHEHFIEVLKDSEKQFYTKVVTDYENYLKHHPDQLKVLIQKCQFIDLAMYDEYEEYNPNYKAYESCLDELRTKHIDDIYVRIFLAVYGYDDDAQVSAEEIIDEYEAYNNFPDDIPIASVYEKLAYIAYYDDDHATTIRMSNGAMSLDSTIDLSYELASAYRSVENLDKARSIILEHTDTTLTDYQILRNAELLIELKASEDAIEYLKWIDYENEEDEYQDYSAIAKILESADEIEEARSYLLKAYESAYSKTGSARALYQYDLKHGIKDSLVHSYSRLADLGWEQDAMGFERLKVLYHAPMGKWRLADLLGFLSGILLLFVLFLVPYLWVLPIPFLGNLLSKKGFNAGAPNFPFGLKDYWYASFTYLAASLIAIVAFLPQDFSAYFDDGLFYDEAVLGAGDARSVMCFMVLMGLGSFWIVRKVSLRSIFHSQQPVSTYIGQLIGFFVLVKVFAYFSAKWFGGLESLGSEDLSITAEIVHLAEHYGFGIAFLFVAIIVPIYEEIIFRGIILSAIEKHMNYNLANVIQALLFTFIHQDMGFFLFYFSVGLVGGMFVKRSNGLLIPILFHMLNNALAMLAIYIKHF